MIKRILQIGAIIALLSSGAMSAVQTKVGSFTATGSAQTISGVGFQPKALIIWFEKLDEFYPAFGYGIADSARTSRAITNEFGRNIVRQGIGIAADTSGNTVYLTAYTSDGFTIGSGLSQGPTYHYVAFGGSDLTNTQVVDVAVPLYDGAQNITTSTAFEPDALIFAYNGYSGGSSYNKPTVWNFGAAVRGGGQFATAGSFNSNVPERSRYSDKCFVAYQSNSSNKATASLTATSATGFTLSWDNSNNNFGAYGYALALKGGNYSIGSFLKSSSAAPTTQTVSGLTFTPNLLMFGSSGITPDATSQSWGPFQFIGATDGTNQRAAANYYNSGNGQNTDSSHAIITSNSTTASSRSVGSVGSIGSSSFGVTWDPNIADSPRVFYLAMGTFASTPSPTRRLFISDIQ